ncbi:MAG: lanthionine synthetase C family protein [Bacteroidales bacterium]|jgi:lantibiotic modifying enzyme|nr:lanthionine synthetase C family protein [Bacteroidales bacterium]
MWKAVKKSNKQIDNKLSEIAKILCSYRYESSYTGLMGGKTGVALFLFYYYKYTNNIEYLNKANELIYADFDCINEGFRIPSYAQGISGILFTLSVLKKEKLISFNDDEVITPFYPSLQRIIEKDFGNGNYDYLHGALGYGINFIKGEDNTDICNYILEELEKSAEDFNDKGVSWKSSNPVTGQTGYNLSLSHGISSIIYFLSSLYIKSSDKDKVYNLLSKTVKYLKTNIQPFDKVGSYFPSCANDNNETEKSRLAWCYGDMGIAISLWQAGNKTNTQEWKNLAEEIMLYSTTRRNIDNEYVKDSGLCHGSSGLGLIFSRMYNYTGISEFKEAANYWLNITMEFANNEDGLAGFKTYRAANSSDYINDPSFLEGVSGVGLFMISAISDIEPVWDTTILLS